MADINITQTGQTLLGGGLAVYLILKLLDRYSNSESFYKKRLQAEADRADRAEKLAADEREKRIKCETEAATLKKHLKK